MKYSDFVDFWEQNRENWKKYQFEVGNVAQRIYKYFLENMEINNEYLIMIPLKNKDDDNIRNQKYTPFACVEFEEYGWANVGIALLIEKGKNTYPKQTFLFKLLIKKINDSWVLKITDDGNEYNISSKFYDDEIEPLWQDFINEFKNITISSLDNWLKSEK